MIWTILVRLMSLPSFSAIINIYIKVLLARWEHLSDCSSVSNVQCFKLCSLVRWMHCAIKWRFLSRESCQCCTRGRVFVVLVLFLCVWTMCSLCVYWFIEAYSEFDRWIFHETLMSARTTYVNNGGKCFCIAK